MAPDLDVARCAWLPPGKSACVPRAPSRRARTVLLAPPSTSRGRRQCGADGAVNTGGEDHDQRWRSPMHVLGSLADAPRVPGRPRAMETPSGRRRRGALEVAAARSANALAPGRRAGGGAGVKARHPVPPCPYPGALAGAAWARACWRHKHRSGCIRTNRCDRQPTNSRSKLELSRPVPTRAEEENQPSDLGP